MKYKAKYGAESDIPAEVKAFYHMQDGEWVFRGSDFDGLDALLNPGLAANRDAIKAEKLTLTTALSVATKERDEAQTALAKASKPGMVTMDAAEQQLLTDYKALGPIKDVQAKIANEAVVSEKLKLVSSEGEIRQLAKDAGLNAEALIDFKLNSERGKNVTLAIGEIEEEDPKTKKKITKKVPMVVTIDVVNGKDKETKVPFAEFAKTNNYPEYLVQAIFTGSASQEETVTKPKGFVAPPSLGERTAAAEATGTKVSEVVDRFNQERSTRRMPWSAPVEKQNT